MSGPTTSDRARDEGLHGPGPASAILGQRRASGGSEFASVLGTELGCGGKKKSTRGCL